MATKSRLKTCAAQHSLFIFTQLNMESVDETKVELRLRAGILGATGMVGQRFIMLLEDSSVFEIVALGASPRTAGNEYRDKVNWKLSSDIPSCVACLQISTCDPEFFQSCDVVFSALVRLCSLLYS
jgi:N-acetyl-gamma-glutamylphosphate reductase